MDFLIAFLMEWYIMMVSDIREGDMRYGHSIWTGD